MKQYRKINEKCAVVAVWTQDNNAPQLVRRGLASLQHRGQESTGITVYTGKKGLHNYVGMGLVPFVLTDKILERLGGSSIAIGHNRYSTTGDSTIENCQPIMLTHGKHQLSIGHNGNIPEVLSLQRQLKKIPPGNTDTGTIVQFLLEKRGTYSSWEETFVHELPHIHGAFSLVVVTDDGHIFGIRDPYGIRPLAIGTLKNGWIIASESVALDLCGAFFVREIVRGEIFHIRPDGEVSSIFFDAPPMRGRPDIFEKIYFARPDSFIDGVRIRLGREESGKLLGKRLRKKGIKPDVVVPIFASGYPAAKGLAEELKLPIVEAIATSHYIGRTFIQPGQLNRVAAVNGKHNFTPDGIVGKRVVFVDDSAVRLTTSSTITQGLGESGAIEVHAAFASPPVIKHCDMGIDMKSTSELPASRWVHKGHDGIEKHAASLILADTVTYLPIEETAAAFSTTPENCYYHPFGGPHPIRDNTEVFTTMEKKIHGKPRIAVFISGGGTNLQQLLDEQKADRLNGEIVVVVSNKEVAYGLTRAKEAHIPTVVVSSAGAIKDTQKRAEFEKQLLASIAQYNVDLIVLAGWLVVLSDSFLKKVQEQEIPVINLHPGLLSRTHNDAVTTSRGPIPVLRGIGTDIIRKAYDAQFPVYGVTVHQVLPGSNVDVGPILVKEEVRRKREETFEQFERRIHDAEYRALPLAVKRICHVLSYNIDVSGGQFPW